MVRVFPTEKSTLRVPIGPTHLNFQTNWHSCRFLRFSSSQSWAVPIPEIGVRNAPEQSFSTNAWRLVRWRSTNGKILQFLLAQRTSQGHASQRSYLRHAAGRHMRLGLVPKTQTLHVLRTRANSLKRSRAPTAKRVIETRQFVQPNLRCGNCNPTRCRTNLTPWPSCRIHRLSR